MKKSVILTAIRILLGCIFIVSGYQKLMEGPAAFAAVIRGYQILSGAPVDWAAMALPWSELILGVFLALGLWRKEAILALWSFNLLFIAALLSAFIRGISLADCGCFGKASGIHFTPVQALIFDLFLFGLFAIVWRFRRLGPCLDNIFDPPNL